MSNQQALGWPRIRLNALELGLIVAALLIHLPTLWRTITTAVQPRAITYTEGVNAILATRPEIWFQPVAQAPHFPTIYPLGYHGLTLAITTLTGLSPFQVMHAIGLLSGFLGALILALLVRYNTDGWLGPAAAASLYGLSPAVSGVTVLGRVDHLGVALGLLALFYAQRDAHRRAALVTVAAMYVKHSLFVFPVTIALYYAYKRRWSITFEYANIVIWVGLSILMALSYITNGEAVRHLVLYNSNHPWLIAVLTGQVVWFGYTHAVVAGVLVYAAIRWQAPPLANLFAVVAVIAALATVGKVGSWVGYFLPTIAAGAWIFGHHLGRIDVQGRSVARTVLILALIVQLGLFANWAGQMEPKYSEEVQNRAIAEIQSIGGPILAEDGTVYVKTGFGQVHEPLMMRFVYEYDSYDGENLASDIQSQRFKRIIIGQSIEDWKPGETSRWHEEELEAMQEHYVRVWAEGSYYVYAPKQAASEGF